MSTPTERVQPVLAVYRDLNGSSGNTYSHIRDLIVDLLHYADSENNDALELVDIVSDIYAEEKYNALAIQQKRKKKNKV